MLKQNNLYIFCEPLLQIANALRFSDKNTSSFEKFNKQVQEKFFEFERNALEAKISSADVEQVKYALAAFIDEVILTSNQLFCSEWMGKSLQLQFFGEHLAGEGFFKRLEQLRQLGAEKIDVLEIYYLCLQLGFKGKYKEQNDEKLSALQVDLCAQIERVVNLSLSINAIDEVVVTKQTDWQMSYWILAGATAILICFIYFGYWIAIEKKIDHANYEIKYVYDDIARYAGG